MNCQKYPRVLIITLNPLSKTASEKVFASFFEGYPKNSMAQLYFHRAIPSSDVCDNYYRISDEDVVNKLLKRKNNLGGKVYAENTEERIIPVSVNNILKKSGTVRFIKASLMSLIDFKDEELNIWLDNFNPEIVFFCAGARSHVCKAAMKIASKYNTKVIQYVTDDYVLPYFSFNIFYMINRSLTRSAFIRICKKCDLILTIGDKMSKVYKEKYGIESKKLMSLVEINKVNGIDEKLKTTELKFVYAGSLHSNRWEILILLGKSLERLEKLGLKGKLEIYSQKRPENKILNRINNKNYLEYCGSLDSDGVKKVYEEADVLVHVESFDRKSKRVTYLSVSTKVPEYMASGKCILAVGPEDVASIEYLSETKSGFVITSKHCEDMDNQMTNIFKDIDKRKYYIGQAKKTAMENHEIVRKSKEFQQENLILEN